jgi:hypothetical protein
MTAKFPTKKHLNGNATEHAALKPLRRPAESRPALEHTVGKDGDVLIVRDVHLSAAVRALMYAWQEADETPARIEKLVGLLNQLSRRVAAMNETEGLLPEQD